MIAGGFLPAGSMGNTETLFAMNGTVLKKISRAEVRRGISLSLELLGLLTDQKGIPVSF